ncbi:hypothetical protein AAVH_28325 [Aphelenchoides avenae]|nr:hypothetical protein AAVH_28325 [Aphelenchus avenae]
MALIVVGRARAKHRYCGNALVMHVGKVCSEVDCDAVDLSVPRMKYVELAYKCCSRGCAKASIERYCCDKDSGSSETEEVIVG